MRSVPETGDQSRDRHLRRGQHEVAHAGQGPAEIIPAYAETGLSGEVAPTAKSVVRIDHVIEFSMPVAGHGCADANLAQDTSAAILRLLCP